MLPSSSAHRSMNSSSHSSVRFMDDTDDPSQQKWKPTTSSRTSIAPPVFISRRSSADFNGNFIDKAYIPPHGKINSLSSIIKKGSNHSNGDEKGMNKRWKPTTSSQASTAPPVFVSRRSSLEFNDNFIDNDFLHDKIKPLLFNNNDRKGIIKHNDRKGINKHNDRKGINKHNDSINLSGVHLFGGIERNHSNSTDSNLSSVWETKEIGNSLRSIVSSPTTTAAQPQVRGPLTLNDAENSIEFVFCTEDLQSSSDESFCNDDGDSDIESDCD
jgi:hypothetical protein